jgi:hypothetical protein
LTGCPRKSGWLIAIYVMNYNFCRIYQTLRVTPAMEAGITDHVWRLEDIVSLFDNKITKNANDISADVV